MGEATQYDRRPEAGGHPLSRSDSTGVSAPSGLGIHPVRLYTSGLITKAGRKDLRLAMMNAANQAAENHPHWRAELDRLEPHLGDPRLS